MSKKLKVSMVILAIITFGIMAVASADDSKDEPTKESSSSTAANSGEQTSASDTSYKLNETAAFKNIKVTATEIKKSTGSQYNKPGDGKIFVGVNFTIENISQEEQSISSLMLFEAYADDVKCSYSIGASMAFSDGTLDGTLAAGKKMVGYYAVEVPNNTKEVTLEVASSWLNSSKATFVIDVPAT